MIVEIKNGYCSEAQFILNDIHTTDSSVVLWDDHSKQFWFCSTEDEIAKKFTFVGDMDIIEVDSKQAVQSVYDYYARDISPTRKFSKTVYMLYSEELKVMDPFSNKAYPVVKYGKPIPRGLTSAKYSDRFERDKVIRQYMDQGFCMIFNVDIHSELQENKDE